jgi:hypothetical protein
MKADRPTVAAYAAAAWLLSCEPRAIQAVAEVEAGPEGAFLDSGEPVILFERHLFHRLTEGRFDGRVWRDSPSSAWALLSSSTPGGYGPVSMQHPKLQAAAALDRAAALKACSWGLFQILGANHDQAGYPILQRFINAMFREVDDHLRAFCMFIRHDARLVDAIRAKDWAAFARTYNGPQFSRNRYDQKMADAYNGLPVGYA